MAAVAVLEDEKTTTTAQRSGQQRDCRRDNERHRSKGMEPGREQSRTSGTTNNECMACIRCVRVCRMASMTAVMIRVRRALFVFVCVDEPDGVSSSGNVLLAGLARPDADHGALHGVLACRAVRAPTRVRAIEREGAANTGDTIQSSSSDPAPAPDGMQCRVPTEQSSHRSGIIGSLDVHQWSRNSRIMCAISRMECESDRIVSSSSGSEWGGEWRMGGADGRAAEGAATAAAAAAKGERHQSAHATHLPAPTPSRSDTLPLHDRPPASSASPSVPDRWLLTAESAGVLGVLRDFDLLDLLTQRRSVASSVLSDHSDLLRATTHSDWRGGRLRWIQMQ